MGIIEFIRQPWPWYIAGPLIGLMVPAFLLVGNKSFGISSNFKHVCAMFPSKNPFFNYNWRDYSWSLIFALGVLLGGFIGGFLLFNPESLQIAPSTTRALSGLGLEPDGNYVPKAIFGLSNLFSLKGFLFLVVGGFLVGFGTRYAGGCTSGHAISGLSALQLPSLVAVVGFFVGGLVMTHFLLPLFLGL